MLRRKKNKYNKKYAFISKVTIVYFCDANLKKTTNLTKHKTKSNREIKFKFVMFKYFIIFIRER